MAIDRELMSKALELPVEEREELVKALLDSFEEEPVSDLSEEELAELDRSIADADRATKGGEMIDAATLLDQMRTIR